VCGGAASNYEDTRRNYLQMIFSIF